MEKLMFGMEKLEETDYGFRSYAVEEIEDTLPFTNVATSGDEPMTTEEEASEFYEGFFGR